MQRTIGHNDMSPGPSGALANPGHIFITDSSSTAYSPISFVNWNRLGNIEYVCQDIRGIAAAFTGPWLEFRCTGECWAYLRDRSSTAYLPIPFCNQNRLGDIEYLCQNLTHRLTYSWQSRSFCWHIIEVLAHLRSASRESEAETRLGYSWLKFPFSLPGFSWPMIEDHSELRSSILSRMSFLDMYEANFD